MKHPVTIRDIIIFVAFIFAGYFAFVKKWDNSQLREDKARAEERIKVLETENKAQHLITDSLKTKVTGIEAVLEYQKQNPKIIIEKYDKIRDNLNLLSTDGTIRFLSDRLSSESSHR